MASQNISTIESLILCMVSRISVDNMVSFSAAYTLIHILWLFVLYTGIQRWRQNKRSTISHSDFLTYHTFLFDILGYCCFIILCYSSLQRDFELMGSATYIAVFSMPGLLALHVLTCVERYVAVIHPIVYLRLKERWGIWVRNMMVFVIWLICPLWLCVNAFVVPLQYALIPGMVLMGVAAGIISFCCVRVLRTLRDPGPGNGERTNQSKQRAFCTMFLILCSLMLWLISAIIVNMLLDVNVLGLDLFCKLKQSSYWFQLPSSAVLPLLFLHRAGKLPRCPHKKSNNN